jgi:hypothetical protein
MTDLPPHLRRIADLPEMEVWYGLKDWEADTHLTPREFGLVVETLAIRAAKHLGKQGIRVTNRKMSNTQKNGKTQLKRKLKASMNDLSHAAQFLRQVSGMEGGESIRFRPKEFAEVFDADQVVRLTRECVRAFGPSFANRVLEEIRQFYSADGTEIVIQRRI